MKKIATPNRICIVPSCATWSKSIYQIKSCTRSIVSFKQHQHAQFATADIAPNADQSKFTLFFVIPSNVASAVPFRHAGQDVNLLAHVNYIFLLTARRNVYAWQVPSHACISHPLARTSHVALYKSTKSTTSQNKNHRHHLATRARWWRAAGNMQRGRLIMCLRRAPTNFDHIEWRKYRIVCLLADFM